jgi:preprotein translocase subunit SecB
MTDQNTQQEMPIFRMQKMYIKDFSFESPNAPNIYLARNQEPKVDFNLELKSQKIDDDHREVSLAITAKIMDKNADDLVMFVVEIEHAAVFLLKNIPEEHMDRVLAVDCPLMLFPFTRQIVSQVSVDGGFMPFLMEPINFIALYENARRKNNEQEQ